MSSKLGWDKFKCRRQRMPRSHRPMGGSGIPQWMACARPSPAGSAGAWKPERFVSGAQNFSPHTRPQHGAQGSVRLIRSRRFPTSQRHLITARHRRRRAHLSSLGLIVILLWIEPWPESRHHAYLYMSLLTLPMSCLPGCLPSTFFSGVSWLLHHLRAP